MLTYLKGRRNRGAALIEYVFLIGLISILSIGAVVNLGTTTAEIFETTTGVLEDPDGDGDVVDDPTPGPIVTPDPEGPGEPDTGPYTVTPSGCLADGSGADVWCGETPLYEVPGVVSYETRPEEESFYGGELCAYDVQSSTWYVNNDSFPVYACESEEVAEASPFCTVLANDRTRYDDAWGGRSAAQVTMDNDMNCEPDPAYPGGYRANEYGILEIVNE